MSVEAPQDSDTLDEVWPVTVRPEGVDGAWVSGDPPPPPPVHAAPFSSHPVGAAVPATTKPNTAEAPGAPATAMAPAPDSETVTRILPRDPASYLAPEPATLPAMPTPARIALGPGDHVEKGIIRLVAGSNQDGNGIAKAAIVALNQAGGQAAKATTAADGSYQMTVPVRATAAARGRIVTESATPGAAAEPSVAIQLQVTVGGKIVLTDEETLTLRAGDIVLRELTVAGAATDKTAA